MSFTPFFRPTLVTYLQQVKAGKQTWAAITLRRKYARHVKYIDRPYRLIIEV